MVNRFLNTSIETKNTLQNIKKEFDLCLNMNKINANTYEQNDVASAQTTDELEGIK